MSLSLNFIPYFDGSNYGYWKSRLRFFFSFLKSIDVWFIVEFGWTPLETSIADKLFLKNKLDLQMTEL
jgi:hypothetical protein